MKRVFVLIGDSGVGKTRIANYLQDNYQMQRVVTHTTRKPRKHERDGIDYYFEKHLPAGFIEHTNYAGNAYASYQRDLDKAWKKSNNAVIVLDTFGASEYSSTFGKQVVIIRVTASQAETKHRMENRGDFKDEIMKRLFGVLRRQSVMTELKNELKIVQPIHQLKNDNWKDTKKQLRKIVREVLYDRT